ncbi:hypothetical protein M9H77_20728 [Catharanthus roseus]|uniref:Uncharacterized protein n=1 Tax=Catharanthus roseus TaxID=4058 RepID=A0ACC0AKJ8_CATRO|nr:hypothetical protein M9H77_20728 [Catharanthus roseus]
MSDLSMYQFEDIVWDEFCQSDDHIVPHPRGEKPSEHPLSSDSRKKPRREVVGISDKVEDSPADKNVCLDKVQDKFSVVKNKRKMLEKESWSQSPDGGFPSPCDDDSIKEVSSLASNSTKTSTQCNKSNNMDPIGNEFCASDAILNERSVAVDSNSYDYPLSHISQEDNLNFFDSSRNDKDSGDFLYYGWPDIGNFEDVDRIFRSCDSTFGLEANNEDELEWFSASDAVEGSGDVLNSEFKFSCPDSTTMQSNLENGEPIDNTCSSINASSMNTSVSCKDGSWPLEQDKHDNISHLSFVNQTSSSDRKGLPSQQGVEYRSEVQNKIQDGNHTANGDSSMMNVHKKRTKQQNQSDEKRTDQYLSTGTSFYYNNSSLQNEESMLPSEATSCQALSSMGIQQQKQATGLKPFSYLQGSAQYVGPEYIHSSDQSSVYPAPSAVKMETNGLTSASPKESYSSNQVLAADSSRGPSFQVTPVVPNEKRDSILQQQVFLSPFSSKSDKTELGVQVPLCDSVSMEKNAQHSGNKFENRGDIEGVTGEVGTSTVQESSSVNSVLDEISLEAASFRQLQLVMEQLDLRTKLCIRDSLYRLARSAEQRHNHANLNDSCCGDDRDTGRILVTEGANKCTAGFVDMETDTNPIDRSIAHLLFHRPSDSSAATPLQDSLPYKTGASVIANHLML